MLIRRLLPSRSPLLVFKTAVFSTENRRFFAIKSLKYFYKATDLSCFA